MHKAFTLSFLLSISMLFGDALKAQTIIDSLVIRDTNIALLDSISCDEALLEIRALVEIYSSFREEMQERVNAYNREELPCYYYYLRTRVQRSFNYSRIKNNDSCVISLDIDTPAAQELTIYIVRIKRDPSLDITSYSGAVICPD